MNEIINGNWKHYTGDRITDAEMSMWLTSNHAMVQNKNDIPEGVVKFFIDTFELETQKLSDRIDKMNSLKPYLLEQHQQQEAARLRKEADDAISRDKINGGFHRRRNNKRSANKRSKSKKSKSRRH